MCQAEFPKPTLCFGNVCGFLLLLFFFVFVFFGGETVKPVIAFCKRWNGRGYYVEACVGLVVVKLSFWAAWPW